MAMLWDTFLFAQSKTAWYPALASLDRGNQSLYVKAFPLKKNKNGWLELILFSKQKYFFVFILSNLNILDFCVSNCLLDCLCMLRYI